MASIVDIKALFPAAQRNKLVLSRQRIPGLNYTDVGREMSLIFANSAVKPSMVAGKETVYRQVLNRMNHDDTLGLYTAIDNIGILFEPELKHNLSMILEKYSTDNWLIIRTDAVIKNDMLHFLTEDSEYKINLSNISYKIV